MRIAAAVRILVPTGFIMPTIPARLRGAQSQRPARAALRTIVLGGLGGFLAIGLLAVLGERLDVALLLGSFGASCVLVFGFPEVPFAQPANVIGGHLISTAIGLAALHGFGPHAWSLALAVAAAIMAMMATRTVHPPAGSNPVIVFLANAGWGFIVFPVLAGAVLLVLVALIYNNLARKTPYPGYW
jgi:CBS-domain-containing membrane protein